MAELVKLPMMNLAWADRQGLAPLGDWRVLIEGTAQLGWSWNGTHYLIDLAADPGGLETHRPEPELARVSLEELELIGEWPRPGVVRASSSPGAGAGDAQALGYTGDRAAKAKTASYCSAASASAQCSAKGRSRAFRSRLDLEVVLPLQ